MTLTRKKLIILIVAFVAVAVIIAAVFACDSNSNNNGTVGDNAVPSKNPYICIVTFDMSGGMIGGENSYKVEVEKNSTIKRPTEIPYREGYVFWGWNTTGDEYDSMWKFDVENITQDITIYATWKIECPVTFYAEGGAFEDGTDTYIYTIAYGDKLTAPKVTPPDEAMELSYWETKGGGRWDFSEPTIGYVGIELYAHWDTKRDIQRALAPFMYYKKGDGYNIYGVVDQNVSGTLTVPNVVTSIEFAAFANCPNIVSVVIDDSVTEIGHHAFQNCKSLKSVILPAGLTNIEYYTFDGCSSLEQIRMPDTLTELDNHAFNGCSSLKSIELDGITAVPYAAFSGCSSLQKITLGDNVTSIDGKAFYD
ncbi:MAG: leucine-rich repeat protein, partial [Clostridiales bacterium]|nr:leucine-rich repeat protein [Clostridiales bacterium]